LTYRSLADVSESIRQRHVSPVDLVNECLEKIERLNPTLRAFITVTGDQARQGAERAEAEIAGGKWRGPLHGIPVGIKDFFDTAGIRTTAAFAAFENRVPTKDAEAVRRLREAGAIVIGKTNMHELGMGTTSVISHFGSVHNPWDPGYVAGGSSGGSGAAIAAGLCYATLDTDAIGSCRLPASCCGVTGFKATYGLVSTKGILEGEPVDEFIIRLGHAAFMCRSADDAAILLGVLGNPRASDSKFKTDGRTAIGSAKHPRLGVVTNFKATPEVRAAFLKTIDTFHTLGYATTDVEAPLEFPSLDLANIEEDRTTISQVLFKEIQACCCPRQQMSRPRSKRPLGLQIIGPRLGEGVILEIAHRFQEATNWHVQHPKVV